MFPIVCNAEGFIIHSGTQFGKTIEEVKEKETLDVYIEEESSYVIFKGEVAGVNNVWLYYYFDENRKLYDVYYHMKKTESYDSALEIHDRLYTLLNEKYGTPLSEDDDIYQLLDGHYISMRKSINDIFNRGYKFTVISWIVQDDNQFIKIDLFTEKNPSYSYCGIEYYPYTEEELAIKKQNLLGDL